MNGTLEQLKERVEMEKVYGNVKRNDGYPDELKEEQIKIMNYISEGLSPVGILPTGYGKSLFFWAIPLCLDFTQHGTKHTSLVVLPLLSLKEEQLLRLKRMEINAVDLLAVNDETDMSNIDVILSTPEGVKSRWTIVKTDKFKEQICTIIIDEAHLVLDWATFREDYDRVTELTSWYTLTPFLLLSATMCESTLSKVLEEFHLDLENTRVVTANPDRPNTFFQWDFSHFVSFDMLEFLLRELSQQGNMTPKTLIYTTAVTTSSKIIKQLLIMSSTKKFFFKEDSVKLFHSACTDAEKTFIIKEFRKADSCIRVVIATVSFGLGIDIPDIRRVIHLGEPASLSEYWQEVGRGGRDGLPCKAFLYHNGGNLSRADRSFQELFKKLKNGECIRRIIIAYLTRDKLSSASCDKTSNCCSNCNLQI